MPTKSGSKQELLQTIEELKLRLERAETDAATAAEALRESEARLRLALKAARMVAWEHDVATNEVGIFEDSHQVLALPSGKRLTNSDHGQSLIHPDDVEKHRALVTEAIQNAGSYTSAYREVRDGEVSWLEERALAVADESGKTIRLVGVTQNITERKRAEQELVRTRNMLMEGQKIAHLGTFEYVAATRTTEWSEEEYRIYGLDPAGPSPAYDVMLTKCIHPDDAALLHETFTKAMQSRSIFELEHRIVRPDGSVRWVHDRAYPYFDDKGNLLRYVGVTLDITERKAAEAALRESEAGLKRAQEIAHLGSWELDLVANRLAWSDEVYRIFGLSPQEFGATYEAFLERVHPDDRAAVDAAYSCSVRDGLDSYEIEHRVVRKDSGEVRHVQEKCQHVRDAHGRIMLSLGMVLDITERKRAEEALRRSEARWNAAIDSFAEGAIIATVDEQVIYWNPAARAMHGFTRPDEGIEPLEKTPITFQLWTPDGSRMLDLDEWPMRRIKRGESVRNLELRICRPDQSWEKVFSYSGDMVDTAGGERLIFLTCHDLTELRKAEQARRESDQRFRLALRNAPVSVAAQDRDLRYIWAYNQRTARPGEIIGKLDSEIFTPEESVRITEIKRRVLEEGVDLREQMWLDRPDGRIFLDICWEPVRDEAGNVTGVASATVDLTPIKQAEEALKTSLQEKEVLLKEIHHRVKNNMQVISSLMDLQADQLENAATRAILQDVTQRVRSMALVHEKLYQSTDMARIDFSEYTGSLLNYLWRAHGGAASGIRLVFESEPVPLSINAAIPCGLILNELATNALKHAFRGREKGEVRVSLHGDAEGEVRIVVRDNGTGLPPDFDLRQAKSLGLSLVQILVKQLSARLEISSGEGTEFSIRMRNL